ncbi:TetR/AcrR family transcriptional regulator [Solihabitans fulvus]|uniref:TetR/AcrR family transcriptional regulator n=1 Tax=Solihabitans fulvus TaxID=1892852 RepID=A0A5B2XT10_9PSEU|nr:TetR/AcrR family transcriptional regulator [Solihabitans fulvus]KAA2266596.1 TetR/AcrR family transcriptional regulator [Solihabitans fulvus]
MPQQPAPTRQRILDAADRLMRTIGLARVTTKEIARASDCSEALLYKHFASKEEIFVAVLQERLPALGPLLAELTADAGGRDTGQCLIDIARQAALFYEASTQIGASLFAEPALLERHRAALRELDAGPHKPVLALAEYLRRERTAGRIRTDADPDAAAAMLLGACHLRAFLAHFTGQPPPQSAEAFAAGLAGTLMAGLARQ